MTHKHNEAFMTVFILIGVVYIFMSTLDKTLELSRMDGISAMLCFLLARTFK